MDDDSPAVWADTLSNGLSVRRYADGDITLFFSGEDAYGAVHLRNESIPPLVKQIRNGDPDRPTDVVLAETLIGVDRIRYFNGVVLIENGHGWMPMSHSLASELADCIEKNGHYGTPDTACSPFGW